VTTGAVVLILLIILVVSLGGGPSKPSASTTSTTIAHKATSTLSADWRGNGKAVTFAFGGDVHFEADLAADLTKDPSTALGPTVSALMSGSQVAMADFDSALTDGTCPAPQTKQFVWYAPPTAITAFQGASLSLMSNANSHGEDCGVPGLQMAIAAADAAKFPVVGIGNNATQAYAPYRDTVNGQRISILAATALFDPGLQTSWSATASQPGLASALNQSALVGAVQAARKTSDTVVVYLNWGDETKTCPNNEQETLAGALVRAGADLVVGSGAHVQQGSGYMGHALVAYGLGNLAFYDTSIPETYSGALVVTATGRHIDSVTWRPAVLAEGLPQPLTGAQANAAVARYNGLRSCTNLSTDQTISQTTAKTETNVAAADATTTTHPSAHTRNTAHSTTSHSTTSHSTTSHSTTSTTH